MVMLEGKPRGPNRVLLRHMTLAPGSLACSNQRTYYPQYQPKPDHHDVEKFRYYCGLCILFVTMNVVSISTVGIEQCTRGTVSHQPGDPIAGCRCRARKQNKKHRPELQ